MTSGNLFDLGVTILFGALVSGTPLLFATLGEIFAERSGVMNLGIEGMMLMGAMGGFATWFRTGDLLLGILVGMLLGGLMALLHAFITITLRADQVVSGLALTILGTGLSSILGQPYVGQRVPAPTTLTLPILEHVAAEQIIIVLIGLVFSPLAWYYLNRTRPGLNLRSVGEHPSAADSLGINVIRTRYLYVVFGGLMSGLAGASMSLITDPGWVDGKASGLGWIAVGLVIFASWDPLRGLWVSYFFGLLRRLPLDLQNPALPLVSTANNPSVGRIMDMLPYLATIFILILGSREAFRKRLGAPAALGTPYIRGQRGL
ncbi:MAG TPA: ABC transporter permease [Anaerolineaceae bacterium]|nr:ABC transporter permease [Anaerolineaceae bacterium]